MGFEPPNFHLTCRVVDVLLPNQTRLTNLRCLNNEPVLLVVLPYHWSTSVVLPARFSKYFTSAFHIRPASKKASSPASLSLWSTVWRTLSLIHTVSWYSRVNGSVNGKSQGRLVYPQKSSYSWRELSVSRWWHSSSGSVLSLSSPRLGTGRSISTLVTQPPIWPF